MDFSSKFHNFVSDRSFTAWEPTISVEEKFGEQNFRVLSEMRILAKIKVVILDFGGVSRFF